MGVSSPEVLLVSAHHSTPPEALSFHWLDILWRILITLLILFALAGPGAGVLNTINEPQVTPVPAVQPIFQGR